MPYPGMRYKYFTVLIAPIAESWQSKLKSSRAIHPVKLLNYLGAIAQRKEKPRT